MLALVYSSFVIKSFLVSAKHSSAVGNNIFLLFVFYNLLMFNYLGSPQFNHTVFCGAINFLAGIWVLFCSYKLVLCFFWFTGDFYVARVVFLF